MPSWKDKNNIKTETLITQNLNIFYKGCQLLFVFLKCAIIYLGGKLICAILLRNLPVFDFIAYGLFWLCIVTISGFSKLIFIGFSNDIGMYMISRQMKESKFHCDALEQYKCEIQKFRLKLQKQRYWNCYGLDLPI